jgi:hypothetical protein
MPNLVLSQKQATSLGVGAALLTLCGLVIIVSTPLAIYLNYLFPVVSLAFGAWFYLTNPGWYFGFTWWIWFLTPFVRRYVDYEVGFYNPGSYIMLAPILVTGLSIFTLIRYAERVQQKLYQPMALALAGVAYGYAVGIFKNGAFAATLGLLEWLCPLLFAFHVLANHEHYVLYRRITRSVFKWGVLVMGIYGIVQYFSPLPWDQFWMIKSEMTTIGRPEPFSVRVFSTLNSPGPFAGIMMVGLIVLLEARGLLARLSVIPGYASFLLSLVRGAWGGFAVALIYAVARLRSRLRLRLLAVLAVGILLSLPLLMQNDIANQIAPRIESLSALDEDNSLRARSSLYSIASLNALTEPIGRGMGSFGRAAEYTEDGIASFDSGVLAIPFTLGWPGGALYVFALLWMCSWVLPLTQQDTDQFTIITVAVVVAMIARLVLSNQLTGIFGLVIWTFLVLAVSSAQHYKAQRSEATAAVRDESDVSVVST